MAVQGVGVLRAAGQRLVRGSVGSGVEHVGVARGPGGEGRLLVGLRRLRAAGAVHTDGGAAPGFSAASQYHLGLAQRQQAAGLGDGVHPGAALRVHGQCLGAFGQASGQRQQSRWVAARAQGIAQHHGIHRVGGQAGLRQQVPHQGGTQVMRLAVAQRTAHGGHRGAGPADDGPAGVQRHGRSLSSAACSAWARAAWSVLPLRVCGQGPCQHHHWRGAL